MDLNFDLDLNDFEGLEIDLSNSFKTRYIKPPKTQEIAEFNLKYAHAESLAKDIKIETGTRYFVVVNGSFYFGDFIEALLVEHNLICKKMTISTLSMCENNIDSLYNLLLGKYVNKLNVIISDYFYSHERNNLIRYMYQRLDMDNRFQLAVAGTHCKLCIAETYCGKYIVIHGSANLRSSGNIEQIVIEESKTLYDFNNSYQDKIISQYKTINKSIRNKKLWHLVQEDHQQGKRAAQEHVHVKGKHGLGHG